MYESILEKQYKLKIRDWIGQTRETEVTAEFFAKDKTVLLYNSNKSTVDIVLDIPTLRKILKVLEGKALDVLYGENDG